MKNAILIHGCCDKEEYYSDKYPSLSNSHWFPWLQKQLLIKDILTQTPEMPNAAGSPVYAEWSAEFERYEINEETILVGYSCGGGFILKWLAENDHPVGHVILVAPWIDYENKRGDFLKFVVDPIVENRAKQIDVLVSDDESIEGVVRAVKEIASVLPEAKVYKFSGRGHFTMGDMEVGEFPELLDIILGKQ